MTSKLSRQYPPLYLIRSFTLPLFHYNSEPGAFGKERISMRAVIQRVLQAQVEVSGQSVGQIDKGLLVYLSVAKGDTAEDAQFMAEKLANLRIFADEAGKMNLSVQDVGGSILLVSNFTLHGDCRKGRRPGFDDAAEPQSARQLYEKVAELITEQGVTVEKGIFGEYMQVSSVNDGPVTFLLDSTRLF
jgi:D-tyrosyl-tRNA(Tyr) deacylase